jgi:uncharacterized protein
VDTGRYLARLIRTLALLSVFVLICGDVPVVRAQPAPPRLTAAVNDFASLVDPASEAELERRIRALMQATGDVIVVATVPSYEGYLDVRELAVKLFENGGRGIGEKGKDNGLLIVVAAKERRAAIEVGYDLESIVTDGFAGETIRDAMIPAFRQGQYGPGLVAAVAKLSSRIAAARGRTTENAPQPAERRSRFPLPPGLIFLLLLLLIIFINGRARRSRRNRWTRGPWSGWSGGVGPFGGGAFGGGFGGFGGGGFGGSGGGGFGGFGGGRSGGGGAAGGW